MAQPESTMPTFRAATAADLPAITALLADDPLGQTRESPGHPAYDAALTAILKNPEDQVLLHAIGLSRQRGCGLVQRTTDRTWTDAHRFYEGLGFVRLHTGMKQSL